MRSLSNYFFVECKPLLGDDYPGVLRTMKSYEKYTRKQWEQGERYFFLLLAGEVRSQAGSLTEIKAFFAQAGYYLRTIAEIEATSPIPYYTEEQLPAPLQEQ